MRVLIAEGLEIVRTRLAGMVRELPDVELVGDSADLGTTVEGIRREQPDLLILGTRLCDGTGFDVLRSVGAVKPRMAVILLCHQLDGEYLYGGRAMGADFVLEAPRDIDLVPSLITKLSGDKRRQLRGEQNEC
jgi:two-component system LytT family response regulator